MLLVLMALTALLALQGLLVLSGLVALAVQPLNTEQVRQVALAALAVLVLGRGMAATLGMATPVAMALLVATDY